MTAQVAVMNNLAIALATDSAVTIRYGTGTKIYNSENKLFTLSKIAPVGAMISGSAGINAVPWEIVIKSYRRHLGSKRFPRLCDYADDLVEYMKGDANLFPEQQQAEAIRSIVDEYAFYTAFRVEKRIKQLFEECDQLTDTQLREAAEGVIESMHRDLVRLPVLPCLEPGAVSRISGVCRDEFSSIRDEALEDLPLSSQSVDLVGDMCTMLVTRDAFDHLFLRDRTTGVVVAGYGENDVFPSYVERHFLGVLEGNVVWKEGRPSPDASRGRAVVCPFAQSDMVYSFMEGWEPDVRGAVTDLLQAFVRSVADAIYGEESTDDENYRIQFDAAMARAIEVFHTGISDYLREKHVDPVLQAIAVLPKDELAALAESLVTLTSLKRRVSTSDETVGGPVDVAVISKGDGFVWIKRKHYFDAALNPAFFQTYLYDLDRGKGARYEQDET